MKIKIALLLTTVLLLASCAPTVYYSRSDAQKGCSKNQRKHEADTVYTVRGFNYSRWYCKNGEVFDPKNRTAKRVRVSAPPSSIDSIEIGMPEASVRSLMGKPDKVKQLSGNKVRWVWALPQCFNEQRKNVSNSYSGYACSVVFENNKVVEYDRGNIQVRSTQLRR